MPHRRSSPFRARALFALLLLAMAFPAPACRYSVRDTGFVDLDQPAWRLRLRGFPTNDLQRWQREVPGRLADANLRLEAAPDDPAPSASTRRALVLVSPDGRELPLADGPEVPDSAAALAGFLENLNLSPLRDQLHDELLRKFAVILLVEGSDTAANADARRAADAAIEAFTPRLRSLPKPFETPPVVVSLAASALAPERLLVWSIVGELAVQPAPRAVVLFGRGRRMGPPLEGPLITRTALQERLALVGQDCECDLDRSWMRGPVFPARWDAARQTTAARLLGFDPENPLVRGEVSRIVLREQLPGAAPRSTAAARDPLALGYREESADAPEREDAEETNAPATLAPTPSPTNAPAGSGPARAPTDARPAAPWRLLAAAAVAALGAGLFLVLRLNRSR